MPPNNKPILVYSTYPSPEVAHDVGLMLVERGLAACVNILPGMKSIYKWQGNIERAEEVVMLIKTVTAQGEAVVEAVKKAHPYDNPALLVVPIDGGSAEFLAWISAETKPLAQND